MVDAALQSTSFDASPLIWDAVMNDSDEQEDFEEEDKLNTLEEDELSAVDEDKLNTLVEEWPMSDPLSDIDEDSPPPRTTLSAHNGSKSPSKSKRRCSPRFATVVSSSKQPLKGPHRRRAPNPAKAAEKVAKNAAAAQARRRRRREKRKIETGHIATASTITQYLWPAERLQSTLNASTLPSAKGAYSAKLEGEKEKRGSRTRLSLKDLVRLGFDVIKWDGVAPRSLLSRYGRIIAVLAGQPDKPAYRAAADRAFETIRKVSQETRFRASMSKHRRGLFAAMNVGLSYGKRQTTPSWLNNKKFNKLADDLLQNSDIERMAGFADGSYKFLTPSIWQYGFRSKDSELRENYPHLRRPFNSSVFVCTAFNFGSIICTLDVLNLAFGWCAAQALGRFDHTKGGHLVLWDLNLVIEFPHGALILLRLVTSLSTVYNEFLRWGVSLS
ncbi:hypothetical protein R3P38DRAFT_2518604 [Favolaschia claudopus]|uniref:Uncharacterized protein n=1 Tax=Favolaschia claudopus TaxID=2862362 RepID=A0AAW0C9E3_9AGAR